MSKIQLYQLTAIIVLGIYVLFTYKSDGQINWLFYLIAAINVILWVLRQFERRS